MHVSDRLCPGFEDRYTVSEYGEVFSVKSQKILRPGPNSKGYLCVCLYDGSSPKKPRSMLVHRLVYEAFCGPIPKGLEINHKDGNKRNNSLGNLELTTPLENHIHARDVLGVGLGEKNGRCKLSDSQVAQIIASGESPREIASKFGITSSYVRQLRRGDYRSGIDKPTLTPEHA